MRLMVNVLVMVIYAVIFVLWMNIWQTNCSFAFVRHKEDVYENLGAKGKKDVKKQKSEDKKSGSVRKR